MNERFQFLDHIVISGGTCDGWNVVVVDCDRCGARLADTRNDAKRGDKPLKMSELITPLFEHALTCE